MNYDVPEHRARRALCATCELPISTCICGFVVHVDNRIEVLLLQHPLEVREAKGTARLLRLCLARCRVAIGETFDHDELAALLHGEGRRSVLLYPGADAGMPDERVSGDLRQTSIQLVVLDGTWRKSLKMLKTNPLLQALPRWALSSGATSRYAALRKASLPTQLSTLEACCLALAQIEGDPSRYEPVHRAFDHFVADRRQRACRKGGEPPR